MVKIFSSTYPSHFYHTFSHSRQCTWFSSPSLVMFSSQQPCEVVWLRLNDEARVMQHGSWLSRSICLLKVPSFLFLFENQLENQQASQRTELSTSVPNSQSFVCFECTMHLQGRASQILPGYPTNGANLPLLYKSLYPQSRSSTHSRTFNANINDFITLAKGKHPEYLERRLVTQQAIKDYSFPTKGHFKDNTLYSCLLKDQRDMFESLS